MSDAVRILIHFIFQTYNRLQKILLPEPRNSIPALRQRLYNRAQK